MKLVLAIGGASGAIYASVLLEKLRAMQGLEVGVVLSPNARLTWELELGSPFRETEYPAFTFYRPDDFMAPFASGSAGYEAMIVCPCSMGQVGRMAQGISTDLVSRAADVILKERRRLVLVVRETPYSLIHIENMRRITLAGGVVCPASPSFYSRPKDMRSLAATVVDRALELAGLSVEGMFRWGRRRRR